MKLRGKVYRNNTKQLFVFAPDRGVIFRKVSNNCLSHDAIVRI